MQYLVVRPFRSFGRYFFRGEIIDESQVRSPRLRASERKIIPVVSSLTTSAEKDVEQPRSEESSEATSVTSPQVLKGSQNKPALKISASK